MNKKQLIMLLGLVAIALVLLLCIQKDETPSLQVIREENPAALSEEEMYAENDTYKDDGRVMQGSVGDSMAVFLQHQKDLMDLDADIYGRQSDNADWLLLCNVPGGEAPDCVYQLTCEGNDEYVLLYLGTGSISHIEAEKEDGSAWIINPEMGKPFAYVMKHSWNVVIYDAEGSAMAPTLVAI